MSAQERNAHFEPFHSLYEPAAFGDYASWISYADFRTQANTTIDVVYMTPREAKNHHGIDCHAGQTVEMPDGRMSIFEDDWRYSRIKCLEARDMMTPFLQSREEVLALNTRNNQELPGYRVDLIPLGECGKQWPYDMAFNATLVDAARSFIRERLMHDGSFIAVHWRHGTSMHKDAEKLADEVLSTLDKHGLTVRRAFLSTNCKDAADLEELTKKLGMEIVQFKDASFAPWQRALIDMIIASEAPLFVPSSYSSSFAKTILFHRVKGKQKIDEDVRTALLNVDNRRTASVRSLARCDVAIISRFSFHSILEKYPWEKRKFQREMKHKLMELGKLIDVKDDINLEQQATQCDALKQLPFFSDNSESMHEFVAELAMNTSTYWYQPGKVLLEEGDVNCDEMFILLRGACEVSSCGQFLGRIENDVIGEIGILDLLERRTATVTTATACQCMKLSRQVMVPILAKYPDARLRLLELARTRLTAINEAMNGPQDGPERGTVAVQDLCGRLPGCAIGFGPHVPKTHQSTTNAASLGPSLLTHSVRILFWWTWCLLPAKGFTSPGPSRLRLATASASSRSQVQLRALPEVPSVSVRDRLLIWQPLIAAVLIFGTYAFIIWKSNRAADARDRRMEKELELRRLRGLQLVRGNAGEDEVEACAAELEQLKLEEKSEREIIGWGVASPTSRRYSLELSSLPQTDVSREYLLMQPAKTEIETERSSGGSDDSEWVESLAVLIGTVDASLLAMNPMFQDAPIPLVYALSQRMVDKKFEDGEVILKDGEVFQPGHDFVYFILKGEVEIWKDGNFIVLLRDGETFGDLAALRKLAARQATAKAKGQVTCRAVLARSLLEVLEQHPSDLVMEIWEEIMAFRESQMKQKADLQKHLTHKTVDIDFMFFKLPAMSVKVWMVVDASKLLAQTN
ncbi:unnamed protein product [Symbiodinium sp. CCMP2592]|nr:unnamed protein product [Symbiodinium sp. CCMP2592]